LQVALPHRYGNSRASSIESANIVILQVSNMDEIHRLGMNCRYCGATCVSLDQKHGRFLFVNMHQVEVHGVPADRNSSKTRVVQNNGFNPSWNETMQFTVTCPQLALVMFRVLDDMPAAKNETIAQYCLPVRCLQTGYRMMELRDMQGERLGPTSLFVHITVDEPYEVSHDVCVHF